MYKGTKLDVYMVLKRRAIELYKAGETQKFIAKALGVSQPSVSRWIKAYKEKGEAFFERPKIGGRKRYLNQEQLDRLAIILDEGAERHGFQGNLWNRARVREIIRREFNVEYKLRTVSNILHHLGYTYQKPAQRSYRQDPQKVQEWREKTLPELKKKLRMKDIP